MRDELHKKDLTKVFAETWDSIVTCFFIDTARNIVEYLERIHRMLKKGGTWINCGTCIRVTGHAHCADVSDHSPQDQLFGIMKIQTARARSSLRCTTSKRWRRESALPSSKSEMSRLLIPAIHDHCYATNIRQRFG